MLMTFSTIAALIFAVFSLCAVLITIIKSNHPFRRALFSAGCGIVALGAVNLFANYTGVSIALNWGTAFVSVVLGAPGVISLLLLRIILIF